MKQKPRNPIARAAILGKGGVHEKSNKAKRQKDKQVLKKKLRAEQFGSFYFGTKTLVLSRPDLSCFY
ncbi:MAG: hypothetical protein L3J52_08670 [Proteobacteria bacterium]|nr:hypothetical protein [Pseudomonadota bacterium]